MTRPLLAVAFLLTACGDAHRAPSTTATTHRPTSASFVTDSCEAVPGAAAGDDRSAEPAALASLPGWRRDDGMTLRYAAPRGATLALVDDSADDEGYVRHDLVGRLARTEYAVVSRTRNEAVDYLLVH